MTDKEIEKTLSGRPKYEKEWIKSTWGGRLKTEPADSFFLQRLLNSIDAKMLQPDMIKQDPFNPQYKVIVEGSESEKISKIRQFINGVVNKFRD